MSGLKFAHLLLLVVVVVYVLSIILNVLKQQQWTSKTNRLKVLPSNKMEMIIIIKTKPRQDIIMVLSYVT